MADQTADGLIGALVDAGATPDEIDAAVKQFKAKTAAPAVPAQSPDWSERLGLKLPTERGPSWHPESTPMAAMKGGAAGLVDAAQGLASGAMRTVYGAADAGNWMRDKLGMQTFPLDEAKRETLTHTPDTFSGKTGSAIETAAELAVPVTKAAEAVPQAGRAGKLFQKAMSVAKDHPVDLSAPGNVALRIYDLAEHGGQLPLPVRKFINYATSPQKGAMTYEVARDFASNISHLSADELMKLKPQTKWLVGTLSDTLNAAVQKTANLAGVGGEHAAAMREYARAAYLRDIGRDAVKGAKRALPYLGGGALGYLAVDKVKSALTGE